MRKNSITLFCVGLLFLISCKKESRTVNNFVTSPAFQIQGIKNVVLERTPFTGFLQVTVPLRIRYGNGVVKRLYLTVISPDSGIQALLSVPSGYPDFETVLSFKDQGAPNGNYSFKLLAHFEGEAVEEFPFTLTLKGSQDCRTFYNGRRYRSAAECKPGQEVEAYSVVLPGIQYDTLAFINLDGAHDTLFTFMDLKCATASYFDYIRGDYRYRGGVRIETSPSYGPPLTIRVDVEKIGIHNVTGCVYTLIAL